MGKYKYLLKNTLLFAISSFGTRLLSFFGVILYTHYLSTSDYGTVDIIQTSATLLVYVFTLNIVDGVFIYSMDKDTNSQSILKYGIRIILYGTLVLGVLLYVFFQFNVIDWEPYCYLFLLIIFVSYAFFDLFSKYLRAIDKVSVVVVSSIMHMLITFTLSAILIVMFHLGVIGYLISIALGYIIAGIYSYSKTDLKNDSFQNEIIDKELKKKILLYSIPLIFNGVAWWINSSIDKYFITNMCGIDQNGVYSVASKIATLLTVFLTVFMSAWNLSAIKTFDPKDEDGFFSNTFELLSASLIVIASFLILVNYVLSSLLFAKDFFIAWKSSSILVLSSVFSGLSSFFGSVFSATKKSKLIAVSTLIAAVSNLVLNWILIGRFGIQGAAIATVISFFIVLLIRYYYSRRIIIWHFNIYKQLISYILIIVQVWCEHQESHLVFVQIIILFILIMINRVSFVNAIRLMMRRKKSK